MQLEFDANKGDEPNVARRARADHSRIFIEGNLLTLDILAASNDTSPPTAEYLVPVYMQYRF
jgi:hypothetical protein